ncbi:MAG: ribonuclease catalytic domain-containing protein [Desulfonauticus sp.]|nr:ribonuclease catalytic domain-containing protein [Desulfonauticus sp.]
MSKSKDSYAHLTPGQVIEFLEDSLPRIAFVLANKDPRVKVLTLQGKEKSLSKNRLLPWVGPCLDPSLTREKAGLFLQEFNQKREEIAKEVNVEEIWELVWPELKRATASWLAEIWFAQKPDSHQIAGLGRALLKNKIYFKYRPPEFEINSQEQVEHLKIEQQKKALQLRLLKEGRLLLQEAIKGENRIDLQTLDKNLLQELKTVLLANLAKRADAKQEKLFRNLTQGLGQDDFLAYTLAFNLGIIPEHFNYYLLQADYEFCPKWTEEKEEIEIIKSKFRSSKPDRPVLKGFISIDSKETRDIDDAFLFQRQDDGFILKIAIACPALHWTFNSALDLKVRERFSSLYLPEGTSHMLPEDIGVRLYSLREQDCTPALIFSFYLDDKAEVKNFSLDFDWIEVEKNISYEEADKLIKEQHTFWPDLYALAEKLRNRRIEQGAVIIEQLEPGIVVNFNQHPVKVELIFKSDFSKAQLIVSELMILCNLWAGKLAVEQNIPLYFRSQKINLSKSTAGVWRKPEDIFSLVKNMAPSILDVEPNCHASLGVEVYAPVTSPLRRYSDFINSAQMLSFVTQQTLNFNKDQLAGLLPYLSARQSLVGQVQRFRPRYWKLLYFKQKHKLEEFEGVLVEKGGYLSVFALPKEQILVRVPSSLLEEKTPVGEKCLLTFGKVDPLRNEIKVVKVRKKDS